MQENISLAPYTTLRIGGPARHLASVQTEADLIAGIQFARDRALPVFVLGGGSNLVVSDKGFPGVVLHVTIAGPSSGKDFGETVRYMVAAGTDWDSFVLEVCERGLSGVECLAGIPGLTGGSPVQNIGAYGQEAAETIVSVRALDTETMQFVSLSNAECGFSYRSSIFNSTARGRYVITQVTFQFDRRRAVKLAYPDLKSCFPNQTAVPLEVYSAIRAIRHRKGMLLVEGDGDARSAGSFFKNPIVAEPAFHKLVARRGGDPLYVPHWPAGIGRIKLAAAWLVENAGFQKGFSLGSAGISSRHSLALINRGGASAAELLALRDMIRQGVKEKFDIDLEQEPVLLGY